MKKNTLFALGVLLSLALAAGTYAAQGDQGGTSGKQPSEKTMKSESPAQPAPGPIISPKTAGHTETLEGELLRIEKDLYVVKGLSGKEVSFKVDKDSNIDSNIAPHDQVIVRATAIKSKHTD